MEQVAMWTAVSTFITAAFGYMTLLAKNRQQDGRLAKLETERALCEKHRTDLEAKLNHEWPADHESLVQAMVVLKANGLSPTVAQLVSILDAKKKGIIQAT